MATFEERLAYLEQEQAEIKRENKNLKKENLELKEKIDLLTVSVGAMVTKATLEQLKEQNGKLFDAHRAQSDFINVQLAELREHVEVGLEGKVVGLQTEMRQHFENTDGKVIGLQTEMRQGFEAVNARFEKQETSINARFEKQETSINARFDAVNARLDQILQLLSGQNP